MAYALIFSAAIYRMIFIRCLFTGLYVELISLRRRQGDVISTKFYYTQRYVIYCMQVIAALGEFLPQIAKAVQETFNLKDDSIVIVAEVIRGHSTAIHGMIYTITLVLWVLTLRTAAIKEQLKQALWLWAPGVILCALEVTWF